MRWLTGTRGAAFSEISLEDVVPFVPSRPVVLEAGSLNGTDTVRFARQWPDGVVHAFEPVPDAYADVVSRTSSFANVRTYPLALSDRDGTAPLFVSDDGGGGYRPDSSSLLEPTGHLAEFPTIGFEQTVDVPCLTLSSWAAREGVERIDFMWLDMQGMELPVLKASPHMLEHTAAVVMEVSREELYANTPLRDEVVDWMTTQGFRVAIDRVAVTFGNMLFVR